MEDPQNWRALAKALMLPPAAPLLVALIGLALMRRRPRLGRTLATLGVLVLVLISLPAVAFWLVRVVDDTPPIDPASAASAQAIVILGGGVRIGAPEYGGDTLARLTLERVRYGARLARVVKLPVIVSGGRSAPAHESEARLMKDALENEFGVPVRWIEDRSRNTHENAVMSAAILRPAGVRRVVLVAHSFDMPRASAEFAAAGLETIAAPTGILPAHSGDVLEYVPNAQALLVSYYALYELAANASRRVLP
jgi:uncharacterized SAM-binding protein YcdF (DUF218 family)